ncbi:MAG TPA: DUF1963 domain-containing protein [Gemmataceae bacterium]|nr:DUF1963 domain-containing protein [Gemmataceae bacterium]
MTRTLLAGERPLLAAVVADLADDAPKLVYADWLEEHGADDRSRFLRAYVEAARTMSPADFPLARKGLPEEWLELIGYRLLELLTDEEVAELKNPVLRLARPALRMKMGAAGGKVAVGASKIGGQPDLPPGFGWPPGGDCHATYNDDTGGTDRLAGFLAQINFAEVADTQAAKDLPAEGLLSFFCFQDIENDNPDAIGAKAVFFPDTAGLVRTRPPKKLTEGNEIIPAQRLTFAETLDLPEPHKGPWSKELTPNPGADYSAVFDHIRELNFVNFLGYARGTTGPDPTPSKKSRHLVVLENAAGCRLHIQLSQDDLAARNFDAITLNWVDFD